MLAGFFAGLLAGVWLQHRWPVGRWREHLCPPPAPTEVRLDELARIPRARRLVIVATGQSNAANYVDTRAAGGGGVFVFHEGKLFASVDPLPGADGSGGSLWTRLGAQLAALGRFDAIVFAVAARGSSRVNDWAPGGDDAPRLERTLVELERAGLPAEFILWQQGETEGLSADHDGSSYLAALRAVQARCRTLAPGAVFVVARATRHGDSPANEQIRIAQAAAAREPRAISGPDLDVLGAELRRDGVHFNSRGAAAAAALWLETLQPLLNDRNGRQEQE